MHHEEGSIPVRQLHVGNYQLPLKQNPFSYRKPHSYVCMRLICPLQGGPETQAWPIKVPHLFTQSDLLWGRIQSGTSGVYPKAYHMETEREEGFLFPFEGEVGLYSDCCVPGVGTCAFISSL